MGKTELQISPKTKVGELLEAYPALEETLVSMSPSFEKLRNPVLRRTVARVATLAQVAIVGGIKVEELVKRLRQEAGLKETVIYNTDQEFSDLSRPGWLEEGKIIRTYNAIDEINSGESPMASIMSIVTSMKAGEIFEFQTPFVPAPVIDLLKSRGFKVFTSREGEIFRNFVCRQ
ncbi:MAG: DUF1858 domain-containing protein [Bacteroidales bacterium]